MTGGLKEKLGVENINTGGTIKWNILQNQDEDKLNDAVNKVMIEFAKTAKGIEERLKAILKKIPGTTVAEKSAYFTSNPDNSNVTEWNKLITDQFELFQNHYLWSKDEAAFHEEKTPGVKRSHE